MRLHRQSSDSDSSSASSSASDSFRWMPSARASEKKLDETKTPLAVRRVRERILHDKYSLPRPTKRRAPPPPAPALVSGWVTVCGAGNTRRAVRVSVGREHTAEALAGALHLQPPLEARLAWRGRQLPPHALLAPLLHASPHLYLFLVRRDHPRTFTPSPLLPAALLTYGDQWETECGVCLERVRNAVLLEECLHACCAPCLRAHAAHTVTRPVSCPMPSCSAVISHRELRALLTPKDFEQLLQRELNATGLEGVLRCATPNCAMWVLAEDGATGFECSLCGQYTCANCRNQHPSGDACSVPEIVQPISELETMECPCGALVTREWGCEWVQCARCKTELCWATRGPRWGPKGRGDTSAGCRCGLDGKRCHPTCRYCH